MGIRCGIFNRVAVGCRSKKLIAGVRYSFYLSDPGNKAKDCEECDQRTREQNNCHNFKQYQHSILTGKYEWLIMPSSVKPCLKISKTKFYECPMSAITGKTWGIIGMVNEITDQEGNILACAGKYEDIPSYLRDAIKIMRQERNRHRKEQMEKQRGK